MRLDKFLADNLAISRKDTRRKIKQGLVTIDGLVSLKSDVHISPDHIVRMNNETVHTLRDGYWMLYKPAGYVCANTDPDHPTVIDLLPFSLLEKYRKKNLQIAGRLDIDTTGLLLITSDGKWNHHITSPKSACIKSYNVQLKDVLTDSACALLQAGVLLHGEKKITRPATVIRYDDHHCKISISEGKYHQVKRMFAAIGNRVETLHRVSIGSITLDKQLMPGHFRALKQDEINSVAGLALG